MNLASSTHASEGRTAGARAKIKCVARAQEPKPLQVQILPSPQLRHGPYPVTLPGAGLVFTAENGAAFDPAAMTCYLRQAVKQF